MPGSLDTLAVAAVFDAPEGAVQLAPVPGHGAGRIAVQIAPAEFRRKELDQVERQVEDEYRDRLRAVAALAAANCGRRRAARRP
ncbi:hypothetical protein [Streptomyces sp. YIM B13502]|uniref:hypothetical protein n=1 Tax=Streptomyces sp. YIM B13502 TaxID=3366317 RepID=UPI0036C1610C